MRHRVAAALGSGIATILLLASCTSTPKVAPTTTPAPLTDQQRSSYALAALQRLTSAFSSDDATRVRAMAAPDVPSAAHELDDLLANVASLSLRDLSFRYVTDAPQLDPGVPGEWAVTAEVTWTSAGDRLDTSLPIILKAEGSRADFVTARVSGTRETPLWLMGRVYVRRTGGVEVDALRREDIPRFVGLAKQALVDLARDLPPLTRTLVLEVPASAEGFATAIGSDPQDVAKLAAITVNQFGAKHASVLVNPGVFATLGPTAAQIVVSHESVHVALNAPGSGMPMWLMEGYADFVALDAQSIPVATSAAQIIAQVKKDGAPAHLPGPKEFNATTHGVGAAYESAWLACKWIADHYGKARLLELYRAADRVNNDSGPLLSVLGISKAELTKDWRAYLTSLAH